MYSRISDYINSLDKEKSSILAKIREEALAARVPIIRDETAALLKCVIKALGPVKILEIGTAVGYSAITMAEQMPENGSIITIENFKPRIEIAKRNIMSSDFADRIELLEGDAGEYIRNFSEKNEKFDFIFMDAAKGQYLNWLPGIKSLMHEGTVLLSDNILQDGTIILNRLYVERRDRTIHKRMREYLYRLKHDDDLESSIIPIGDGVAFSVKI